jgi:hypothetical protein
VLDLASTICCFRKELNPGSLTLKIRSDYLTLDF